MTSYLVVASLLAISDVVIPCWWSKLHKSFLLVRVYQSSQINTVINTEIKKQEAHGPHHPPEKIIQINKHICLKPTLIWKVENYHLLFYNQMVLICKTLSSFHLRMLYAKFGWNWPNGSLDFVNVFYVFGHEIYNLGRPFLGHHYNILTSLSKTCSRIWIDPSLVIITIYLVCLNHALE